VVQMKTVLSISWRSICHRHVPTEWQFRRGRWTFLSTFFWRAHNNQFFVKHGLSIYHCSMNHGLSTISVHMHYGW